MANYTDFLRQHAGEKPRVRRLYWVCGEEEVFRLAVVARLKEVAAVAPYNTLTLSAAETPESEIWAHLNQHPLDSDQKRLIVVHEAQRLVGLNRLVSWVKDNQTVRSRNAVAIFVSSDPDLEHEERDALAASSSALIVKCSLPKDEKDRLKRATEIVCAWGNIDSTVAGVLVKRVNYDMHEALAFMQKANLFPNARISVAAVEALTPRRVEEDVVWSLIGLNKRKAVEAVEEAAHTEAGFVLGSLAAHIEALGRLNAVLSSTTSVRDMARKIEAREGYVRTLLPYAKFYSRKETVRRTVLLNRMDDAYHRGAKEGVLEALIALW